MASPSAARAPLPPLAADAPSPQAASTRCNPIAMVGALEGVSSRRSSARVTITPGGSAPATSKRSRPRRREPTAWLVRPTNTAGPAPLLRAPVALSISVLSAPQGTLTVSPMRWPRAPAPAGQPAQPSARPRLALHASCSTSASPLRRFRPSTPSRLHYHARQCRAGTGASRQPACGVPRQHRGEFRHRAGACGLIRLIPSHEA